MSTSQCNNTLDQFHYIKQVNQADSVGSSVIFSLNLGFSDD